MAARLPADLDFRNEQRDQTSRINGMTWQPVVNGDERCRGKRRRFRRCVPTRADRENGFCGCQSVRDAHDRFSRLGDVFGIRDKDSHHRTTRGWREPIG